ncbi:MAG TPA: matrixin family metalloprotease [Candidatus Paceibacterota bacterium]|nr:matrixin family metalloprotease [Candidatus Paceibacterota bacterium]
MKKIKIILIISLIFCLIILVINYFIYFSEVQKFVRLNEENSNEKVNLTIKDYTNGLMFYENMRFPSKSISYSIDSGCNDNKKNDSREAFKEIEKQTNIKFIEISKNGEIEVICSNEKKQPDSNHFISGEGGPLTIINLTNYYVIFNGTMLLYEENKCKKPIVAIHEILHVLGFEHSKNEKSIMYPYYNCNQIIDEEIINKINQIYEIPTLPDLTLDSITAEKHGFYLDFEMKIFNKGFSDSNNTNLSIYADNKLVSNYEIGSLKIGSGKTIRVNNLKIPLSIKKISFIIDQENVQQEINKENNKAVLSLNK